MKKNKKGLFMIILAISTSMLSACNKTPTAKELLTKEWNIDNLSYADVNVEISLGIEELSEQNDTPLDIDLNINTNMISSKNISYLDGEMDVDMLGMSVKQPYKLYTTILDDTAIAYTYDADSEQWFYEVVEKNAVGPTPNLLEISDTLIKGFDIEIFKNYEMKETETKDDYYTITGILDSEKLFKKVKNNDILNPYIPSEDYNVSDIILNTTILYDKNTQHLTSIEINIDPESINNKDGDFKLKEGKLYIKINEMNNKDVLEIPQNIIEKAEKQSHFDGSTGMDLSGYDEGKFPEDNLSSVEFGSTDNFANYQFYINKNTLTLPASYEEINKITGWKLSENDLKSYMKPSLYENVGLYNKNEDLVCYIGLRNDSEEEILYSDCKVTYIIQSKNHIEKSDHIIMFPYGFQVGNQIKQSELLKAFGQPTEYYESTEDNEYIQQSYKWYEKEDDVCYNYIHIVVVNGIINEISLSCRG